MQATTLTFANLHNHGQLFANIIHARRDLANSKNKWDMPRALGATYDQYDTPQANWLAVHDDEGRIMAGARLTPTTAQCGVYSYMIKDAQNGLLDTVPQNVLYEDAPVDEEIWEVTKGFVAPDIPTSIRRNVHLELVGQILRTSRAEGVSRMLALMPANWARWGARCQLDLKAAGPVFSTGTKRHQAVWIDVTRQLH